MGPVPFQTGRKHLKRRALAATTSGSAMAVASMSTAAVGEPSTGLTTFFYLLVLTMIVVTTILVSTAFDSAQSSILTNSKILLAVITFQAAELLIASTGALVSDAGSQPTPLLPCIWHCRTNITFQSRLSCKAHFDQMPPSIGKLLVPAILLSIYISCVSSIGEKLKALPVRTLIGFQAFRFGPEAFLHLGYLEGSLPSQMSWCVHCIDCAARTRSSRFSSPYTSRLSSPDSLSRCRPPEGQNFDIFIASAALALLLYPRPLSKPVAWLFALFGLLSLVNIARTSIMSLTDALRPPSFQPGLEMAARPPFILLPGFLVQIALCGQLVLVRRLLYPPPLAGAAKASGEEEELW